MSQPATHPSPEARVAWRIGLLLAIAILSLYFFCRGEKARQPLELGFWYWHSPYSVTAEDEKELRARGLNKMFVRTGTAPTRIPKPSALKAWRKVSRGVCPGMAATSELLEKHRS